MPRIDNWVQFAQTLGYESEHALWTDLYLTERMSLEELSNRLGVGRTTIRHHLLKCKIPLKTRGGPNGRANQKRRLFFLNPILLFQTHNDLLAKLLDTSASTVYHYKSTTLGGSCGILHNITNSRVEPVFPLITHAPDPSSGEGR